MKYLTQRELNALLAGTSIEVTFPDGAKEVAPLQRDAQQFPFVEVPCRAGKQYLDYIGSGSTSFQPRVALPEPPTPTNTNPVPVVSDNTAQVTPP